jgi:hypothetical protein
VGQSIESFRQLLAANAPAGFGSNREPPILVFQAVDYTFKPYTGLAAPVGDGLEPMYQEMVAAFIQEQHAAAEAARPLQDRWAEWLVGQSGLDELDPEFAASLQTSLSWGIGLGLDAAGTAYAVGSAVYTVGEAIVQSYIDTAVGYYNAGGGGANGVLLAISGVSGVAGLAEGWYGYVIGTGEQLSGLDGR